MSPDHDRAGTPLLSRVQRLLDAATRVAMPLALVVTVLLFAQWPLRDLLGRWSTDANDLAQWVFALYVGFALRHAGERGAHLNARPDLEAAPRRAGIGWRQVGAALCVLPWALFVLSNGASQTLRAVAALERFPETGNAGYFMLKLAAMLLALLLAAQSAGDLWRALRPRAGGAD